MNIFYKDSSKLAAMGVVVTNFIHSFREVFFVGQRAKVFVKMEICYAYGILSGIDRSFGKKYSF